MKELPKYHEIFIPVLEILRGGEMMHVNELQERVMNAYYSNLSDELLSQKIKNGTPTIHNRISWAKTYLKMAKMVSQPSRAMIKITDKGLSALNKGSYNLEDIKKDNDYIIYNKQKVSNKDSQVTELDLNYCEELSPQELIDNGIQRIEDQVKIDLIDKLKTINPYYFEKVVLELFNKMGYGDFEETSKSGDGGIDGIINQDELGLEKIYVQVKRYNDHNVRETEIRNFIGAMSGDTQKGIFVTTSSFDNKAIQKTRDAHHTIILIDGLQLVDLMYKFGVGVQVKNTYYTKAIDEDYFIQD